MSSLGNDFHVAWHEQEEKLHKKRPYYESSSEGESSDGEHSDCK